MLNAGIWAQLENSRGRSSDLVVMRLLPQSKFNVFAAVNPQTSRRCLLLKSNREDVRPLQPLPSGRGFEVRFLVTSADRDGGYCIQLELIDPLHSDVFDVIGNDVLNNIIHCSDDKEAFNTFVARIKEWQSFLDQLPRGGLDEQAQQGLFAELWFLREFLLGEMSEDRAVSAWGGPKALAKDFQFSALAFEVKASSGKQHSRFHISNELQLDMQSSDRLILFCLLLERLAGGGLSLSELVAAIRENLRGHSEAAVRFSEMLLEVGYQDAEAANYTTRFAVRSQHFFDVRDDFPRIVERDLRIGVGDVRYSILFSECQHYEVNPDNVRNLIRRISL
ncbi:PD-(D/E)XK motif protein [Candidatus Manganitrophus noduliformans]|uniref:PD-(D/E)XK motif protein n=1 Tax=Candidatus Manganitrophus noduliformans TaxID=2606439 RepID=A0A7X6DQ79_9BACT|nr:PD-(D/E)XK motif protein [Candidatus Manganitrophus noduliformans]NKE71340.1 PD-(D/E)XK motif protein [Candidatus Manganitrophus noduliformans]